MKYYILSLPLSTLFYGSVCSLQREIGSVPIFPFFPWMAPLSSWENDKNT